MVAGGGVGSKKLRGPSKHLSRLTSFSSRNPHPVNPTTGSQSQPTPWLSNMLSNILFVATLLALAAAPDPGCYVKWLIGHKLNHGLRVDGNITLEMCKLECVRLKGCAAFAFGSGECELATRRSRSISNVTLDYADLEKKTSYDVYIERDDCGAGKAPVGLIEHLRLQQALSETSPAYSAGGVPLDCFYRLMSGKRLVKHHVLKGKSVSTLQECQDSCISEKSFDCRGVSYRYMPSGYTYNVANCELSPFYLVDKLGHMRYDFIDDYDYDYFQREPKCNTNNNVGFGVCSRIGRRSSKVRTVVKSSVVNTLIQCEYLCATAFFRCKAFSFRHTERGGDQQYHRNANPDNCLLHNIDIDTSRDIESDRDFDVYEMGSLVNNECVLLSDEMNFHSKRPGSLDRDREPDREPVRDRERDREPVRDRDRDREPIRDRDRDRPRDRDRDREHGNYNYLPDSSSRNPHIRPTQAFDRPSGPGYNDRPHFDRPPPTGPSPLPPPAIVGVPVEPFPQDRQEACLVKLRQDYFIQDENARATFPVKTIDECKAECLRSMEVLRFPCRVMAFRLTSSSGGSCQLADLMLTPRNFEPARERDHAVVFVNEGDCGNNLGGPGPSRFPDSPPPPTGYPGDRFSGERFSGERDRNRFQPGFDSRYSGENRYQNNRYLPDRPERPDRRFPPDRPDTRYHDRERPHDRERFPPEHNPGYPGRFPSSNEGDRYLPENPSRYPQENRYSDTRFDRFRPQSHERFPSVPADRRFTLDRYPPPPTTVHLQQTQPSNSESTVVRNTVNGEKCKSACRQNREAGFYYCIIDDQGSWDFCCRPDHFCGFSRGLSVPWCYVGTGPSQSIWRSCNHRLLTKPHTSYLHEREPPSIHKLSNDQIANLTKDNALQLLENVDTITLNTGSSSTEEPSGQQSTTNVHRLIPIGHPGTAHPPPETNRSDVFTTVVEVKKSRSVRS